MSEHHTEHLEPLLDTKQVSELIGRAESTLEKDRGRGGPNTLPFIKLNKQIRYRPSDVRDWIKHNVRRSTSDPGPDAA